MLSLRPVLDPSGNMVIYLPSKIDIKGKIKVFNQTKKTLLGKYPDFKRAGTEKRLDYINERVNNSIKIAKVITLSLETSNQPRLKSGETEYSFNSYSSLSDSYDFLDSQIESDDYVEVHLVVFQDGSVMTVTSNKNTPTHSFILLGTHESTGNIYLRDGLGGFAYSKPIAWIAHTHHIPGSPASETDRNSQNKYPGIGWYIYNSGGILYDFDKEPFNP